MPRVGDQHFPYTPAGYAAAARAKKTRGYSNGGPAVGMNNPYERIPPFTPATRPTPILRTPPPMPPGAGRMPQGSSWWNTPNAAMAQAPIPSRLVQPTPIPDRQKPEEKTDTERKVDMIWSKLFADNKPKDKSDLGYKPNRPKAPMNRQDPRFTFTGGPGFGIPGFNEGGIVPTHNVGKVIWTNSDTGATWAEDPGWQPPANWGPNWTSDTGQAETAPSSVLGEVKKDNLYAGWNVSDTGVSVDTTGMYDAPSTTYDRYDPETDTYYGYTRNFAWGDGSKQPISMKGSEASQDFKVAWGTYGGAQPGGSEGRDMSPKRPEEDWFAYHERVGTTQQQGDAARAAPPVADPQATPGRQEGEDWFAYHERVGTTQQQGDAARAAARQAQPPPTPPQARNYGVDRAGKPLTEAAYNWIISRGGKDSNNDGRINSQELEAYHAAQAAPPPSPISQNLLGGQMYANQPSATADMTTMQNPYVFGGYGAPPSMPYAGMATPQIPSIMGMAPTSYYGGSAQPVGMADPTQRVTNS